MSHTDIPADVQAAADELFRKSNEDLDDTVTRLVDDMRKRDEDERCNDAMGFGHSLVTIHENIYPDIPVRLHGVYLAAVYRLARQQITAQAAQTDGLSIAARAIDDYIEKFELTGDALLHAVALRDGIRAAVDILAL